jgi:hypothetical protein
VYDGFLRWNRGPLLAACHNQQQASFARISGATFMGSCCQGFILLGLCYINDASGEAGVPAETSKINPARRIVSAKEMIALGSEP